MVDKKETQATPVRIMVSLHIPKATADVAIEIRELLQPLVERFPDADLNVSLGNVRR